MIDVNSIKLSKENTVTHADEIRARAGQLKRIYSNKK